MQPTPPFLAAIELPDIDWSSNLRIIFNGILFVLLALVILAIAIWLMGFYLQRRERSRFKEGDADKIPSKGAQEVGDDGLKVAIAAAIAAYSAEPQPAERPKAGSRAKTDGLSRWESMSIYELMEDL